ncbi:hypothetical protein [Nocardia bhagyanarayanae]|uniref:Uncharacterized protein n=1 Tax=Nocardia bhagyanarayanae TaxID=1215925 RepID=A0A543FGD9_9NOCA|nr:hypothetical protein [Nocardia bhagyanarayanae]TQM32841.1 hypothetical protein FB390_4541 [Nocardia bhagyanarayanae]
MIADKCPKSWRPSRLPDRLLTSEQALAGMDLAEIVSTQTYWHDPIAHPRAVRDAGQLGIPLEQILLGL